METVKNIKITRSDITGTEMFQSLNPILQQMTLRRGSVMAIEHGVNVASNIGFEAWEKQTATRYSNRMIVKEIMKEIWQRWLKLFFGAYS